MKLSSQWDVRAAVAVSSVFHFLQAAGEFCLLPYFSLYLRHLGLAPFMVGVIMGVKRLVGLGWGPLAPSLAKRYDRRRAVLLCSLVGSVGVALALQLLTPVTPQSPPQLTAHNLSHPHGDATTQGVPQTPERDGRVSPSGHGATPSTAEPNTTHIQTPGRSKPLQANMESAAIFGILEGIDAQHQLFLLLLVAAVLWELLAAPLNGTADDGLFEYLDFVDATNHQGTPRVWRLLGAAGGAGGAGALVSRLGGAVHFYGYAVLSCLALLTVALLPLYRGRECHPACQLLKALQLLRSEPRVVLCAATAFLAGVANACINDFLLWQLEDIGGNELHMGVALATALLSQLALMVMVDGRLARLMGFSRLLVAGGACLALPCLYYSFVPVAWWVLPAQAVIALSSGAIGWVTRQQCEDVATPGTGRCVAAVFQAVSGDLGAAAGSLTGGFVVQHFGVPLYFRAVGVALLLWSLVLPVCLSRLPQRRTLDYHKLLANGADGDSGSESDSDAERDWLEKAMEDDRWNNNW